MLFHRHKGSERKDFIPEEADTVRCNSEPPANPCCEKPSLRQTGTENHAVYNFKPMKLEKVMNVKTQFHCDNCGQDLSAPTPDAMPGAKFSNAAAAQIMTEWALDGKKAYAWIFANDAFKVFLIRDSRGSKFPWEILGNEKLMPFLLADRYRNIFP